MSRLKKYDSDFKTSIDLGKRSNQLIPKIKNWCSKIHIQSDYGGMMGEMGLPTMNTISCTEFNGDSAMNLEWIAGDFIVDHCIGCKVHDEVNSNNFGRKTLAEHTKRQKEIEQEIEIEQKIIDNLNDKLKKTIVDRKSSKTTELSIIKLLLSINKPLINKTKKSLELLEASKISPEFFNSLSLDYLTIYFKDEDIRENIINTAHNVIQHKESSISKYFIEKVVSLLKSEFRLEILIKIIPFKKLNQNQVFSLIPFLIEKYDSSAYDRSDYFKNHSPSIISFFNSLFYSNESKFFETLKLYLKEDKTYLRANAALILYQLFYLNHNITLKLIPELIRALDLNDDGSPKSVDSIILKLLFHISEIYPKLILDSVDNEFSKIKLGGKIEIVKFHKLFVLKTINSSHEIFTKKSINKLFTICLNKNSPQELKTETINSLESISQEFPSLLMEKIDSAIATLSQSIINKSTFNFYINDLDNNTLTFNPLEGKNIYDLNIEKMKLDNELDSLKSILKNLLEYNQSELFQKLIEIIDNTTIGDEYSAQLKLCLIEIIKDGVSDSILLTKLLPQLHTWLLDFKNLDLRKEALKLLEKLLKDNFHIIPQTIFNLLVIFIEDSDNIIRKYAIGCYNEILKTDTRIENTEIDLLLNLFSNKYVIIHKNATNLTHNLFAVLDRKKRSLLLGDLLRLLEYYHNEAERDYKFCNKLFNQIIYISKRENPNHHSKTEKVLIENYLITYCENSDYYRSLEALKKLTHFKQENSDYNKIWLEQILKFTYRYKLNKFEPFKRSEKYKFYLGIFSISLDDFLSQNDFVKTSIKNLCVQSDSFYHEMLFTLELFSFFNLNRDILEIVDFIELNIKRIKSKSYFFKKIDIFKKLSQLNLINEINITPQEKKILLNNSLEYENEIIVIQENLVKRKIIYFENFKIKDIDNLLSQKEYFISEYEKLIRLSQNTFDEGFFTNFSYLHSSIFLLFEWGKALLNGEEKALGKLEASKLNINLIDLEYFSYLSVTKNHLGEIIKCVNSLIIFNEENLKSLIKTYLNLKIPFIHHLREKTKKLLPFNGIEEDIKQDEVYILSLELYLKNNPWANPQILKSKEIYAINGTIKLNTFPTGYEFLKIQPATTNSNSFELNMEIIELTDSLIYQINGNIVFNFSHSSIEDITSIKLIPYFSNNESNLCPTIIGYDELITKVLDEKNELFRTGFKMMNKKVFELYEHSLVKQLDSEEQSNLFIFLNGISNYQGYCLQSGKYKGVSTKKENEFRDELIQHLVANPNIGEAISKESEVAGGRVELSYKGIIAELKVEKKISERTKIINKYSNQALSYSSGSSKLVSIVCVLDLTEKKLPPSPGVNNIIIHTTKTHGFSENEPQLNPFQIFVFIDGNTVNPSDYSK